MGLEWLRDVNPSIVKGKYEFSSHVKAIVSEYITKEENGYEAHRDYVDIQYFLKGNEKACCLPSVHLKETKAYKTEIAAAFYEKSVLMPSGHAKGNGYCAVFFSQAGHMPELIIEESSQLLLLE